MTDSVASEAWRPQGGRADQFFPTNGQLFPTATLIDHGQRHPAVEAPTARRLLARVPRSARLRKRFRRRLRQGDGEGRPAARAGAQEPQRPEKSVPPGRNGHRVHPDEPLQPLVPESRERGGVVGPGSERARSGPYDHFQGAHGARHGVARKGADDDRQRVPGTGRDRRGERCRHGGGQHRRRPTGTKTR